MSQPADFTIDHATERYQQAEAACLRSDDLQGKALDWASLHAHEHAALMDQIVQTYVATADFDTWVEDVADGVDAA